MKICLASNWDDKLLEGVDDLSKKGKERMFQKVEA